MDSSKKEAITEDSPSPAGDPKFRSVTGLNSASSSLSINTFRQGINPQATSTPYPTDEREKSSRPPLKDTPLHSLFQSRAPKQDPTLSDAGLKLRKPKVCWPDEEEGGKLATTRDRSTSPPEPKRQRLTPYKKDRHHSNITDEQEQEEEWSTTQDRSTSPSERKRLHETPDNNVPELVNMEPHTSPSHTPNFPLGRGAHTEAIHIDCPEPIDPTRVSASPSPSRWSEGFRNETKTPVVAGCEEGSNSSVNASALLAATTTVKGKTAATEAEANYLARSALYYSRLQAVINKRGEAGASACEVESAIGAKKQQLDEAMRGINAKYQSVLEKLKYARQVPVPKKGRC